MAALLDPKDALARMTAAMNNAPPPARAAKDLKLKPPTRAWLDAMYGSAPQEEAGDPVWLADHVQKNEDLRKAVQAAPELTLQEGERQFEIEPPTSPLLEDDRATVLVAVKADGLALARAPVAYRADEEIVRAAVTHTPRALKYASSELRAIKELVLDCVKRDGMALHCAAPELYSAPDMVEAAMAQFAAGALKAEALEEEELRQCPVAPFYPEGRDHTTFKWRTHILPSDPAFELPPEVAGCMAGVKDWAK